MLGYDGWVRFTFLHLAWFYWNYHHSLRFLLLARRVHHSGLFGTALHSVHLESRDLGAHSRSQLSRLDKLLLYDGKVDLLWLMLLHVNS